MSQLLILGNTNKYTFYNAIVAAQNKAKECTGENLTEIYVIHSKESFQKLFREETDWLESLKQYCIDETVFINRIIHMDKHNTAQFLAYIRTILVDSQLDKIIIDMSNGTSEMRTILSIIAYVLAIPNVFLIDSVALFRNENTKIFLDENCMKKYYKKMIDSKDVDELAYLNLTEIVRYKEKVDELSAIYNKFCFSDSSFFKENLLNAILLKLKNDNDIPVEDNTLYRISSTAIASSLEDLIDKLLLDYGMHAVEQKTLGTKIHYLQSQLKGTASPDFDFKFLEKFNEFMLYLRNSTTHKGLTVSDSEKFKAGLSIQMSLIFLEYYSKIVYKELKKVENTKAEFSVKDYIPDKNKKRFFGLDGDNTGQALESLLQSNQKEKVLREFSDKIKKAKDAVVAYIKESSCGKVIFAEGDDILFRGKFSEDDLIYMKDLYFEKSNMTCSIAYGESLREVLISMKIAKMTKNSIRGISIKENELK